MNSSYINSQPLPDIYQYDGREYPVNGDGFIYYKDFPPNLAEIPHGLHKTKGWKDAESAFGTFQIFKKFQYYKRDCGIYWKYCIEKDLAYVIDCLNRDYSKERKASSILRN